MSTTDFPPNVPSTPPSHPACLSASYRLEEAQPAHLPTLATVHTRSFHPSNRFHMEVFPDTPRMREWWQSLYRAGMRDPSQAVLVVTCADEDAPSAAAGDADADADADAEAPRRVVGIIMARRSGPDAQGSGMWETQFSGDSDMRRVAEMQEPMRVGRPRLCGGRWHWFIEFFGVDAAHRGTGAGKALLGRVCDLADAEGLDAFVDANQHARAFYEKFGFERREDVVLSGEDRYTVHLLLRPATAAATAAGAAATAAGR